MRLSGLRQLLFNFYPLRWASEQEAILVYTSILVGLKALAIEVEEHWHVCYCLPFFPPCPVW